MQLHHYTFPDSIHEFKIKAGNGIVIVFQVDLFERWIVHIRLDLNCGKISELYNEIIGIASEDWFCIYFDEDESEYFE